MGGSVLDASRRTSAPIVSSKAHANVTLPQLSIVSNSKSTLPVASMERTPVGTFFDKCGGNFKTVAVARENPIPDMELPSTTWHRDHGEKGPHLQRHVSLY